MNSAALSVSLNEIEQISLKATRGAGAGWGVAEDVARAARWMAERGLDWSTLLLRLLDGGHVAERLRDAFEVADLLAGAQTGDRWTVEGCEPIWLLAILSAAAYGRSLWLDLAWEGGNARMRPDGGVDGEMSLAALGTLAPPCVTIAIGAPRPAGGMRPAPIRRGLVAPAAWRALDAYAARTYVAASATSRATGAGGGKVDDE